MAKGVGWDQETLKVCKGTQSFLCYWAARGQKLFLFVMNFPLISGSDSQDCFLSVLRWLLFIEGAFSP